MIIDEEVKQVDEKSIESGRSYPNNINEAIGFGWYFILFSIVAAIPLAIVQIGVHTTSKSLNSLFTLLSYAAAAILTIRYGFKRNAEVTGFKYKLKFNKVSIIVVIVSSLMILTMPVLTDPVSILIPMPDFVKKMFSDMFDLNIFAMATAVIAAPVLEEIMFRGIILDGLLKNCSPQKAIITSAAIFAVVHLNPWQAIPAFLGGLIMGWMYWKTNSIIPGMILHFFNNAFSTALGLAFPKIDTLKEALSMPVYISLFAVSAIILFGGWMFLEKYFENNPTPEDEEEFEQELAVEE